ncbi:alpha/beta fold hydrolase [Sinomonas atrocyanea]
MAQGHGAEPGWWDALVGPGKPVDTEKYFVVAANMLGGCYGSTGPSSLDPEGVPWGSRFPFVTIRDSVRAEARLADRLGVRRWHAVLGGSMGGARALEWAAMYPDRVRHCVVVAIGGTPLPSRSPSRRPSSSPSARIRRTAAATTTAAPHRWRASAWRGASPTSPTAPRPS